MNTLDYSQNNKSKQIKAADVAKWLLARGVSSITTDELAVLLGVPKSHVPQRMISLRRKSEIISLTHGLWIPVPPEYMTWGAPPAMDIIDALMKHLSTDYYVGWLSAAEIHGASHHAPQVFQVAVSRSLRSKTLGRSILQFYHREHIKRASLTMVESRNGKVPVSDRESTMLDIANNIRIAGGIDNSANLIIELCEAVEPDIEAIIKIAAHYPTTAVRRLGFLLELFTNTSGLDKLAKYCEERKAATSILDSQAQPSGSICTRWNIKLNREVSPDI